MRERREKIKILQVLGSRTEIKLSIIELLRKYGCFHLSGLYRYLKGEKNAKLGISTLHKYVKEMVDAGILTYEKGEKYRMIYISIAEAIFPMVEWLLTWIPSPPTITDPRCIEHIARYVEVTKPSWNNVTLVLWGNKRKTLAQYAPLLVLMLTASMVDPYKQIVVLNNVAKKIGVDTSRSIEISLGELLKGVEEELKRINPSILASFQELQQNSEDLNKLKTIIEKRLVIGEFATLKSLPNQIVEHPLKKYLTHIWYVYVIPNLEP